MTKRRLGKSNLEVSAMGLGCWTIGGPWDFQEPDGSKYPCGWGQVDDAESISAIRYALDAGINFFDTAANYGCGHSERTLAKAIAGRRNQVILSTKFGYVVDEEKRIVRETDDVLPRIRKECENSLRNLKTDYIDLYHFHRGEYPIEKAAEIRELLETLVTEGKIRWYGWSTDNPEGAKIFAQGAHCTAIQHILPFVFDAPLMLAICDEYDQASINRSPLGMGSMTGKQNANSTFPADDVRHGMDLTTERFAINSRRREAIHKFFADSEDSRTLAQIILSWYWARSERTIPIPGFRNVAQVKENIQTMEFNLLTKKQMEKIEEIYNPK